MMLVKDVMRTRVEFVKPDDLVTHARSLIRDKGLRILPVCEDSRLVGILSRGDVLKVTSTKTNLKISGIMHKNVITVSPEDHLIDAGKKIAKLKVLYLPVVEDGRLLGVLSSRAVLKYLLETKKPTPSTVSEIMTSKVITCTPKDELSKIWNKMIDTGLGGLPVIEKNVVKGMVTKLDLIRRGSARLLKESGKGRKIPVKKVMNTHIQTVNVGSTVEDAASVMISKRITKLPVVDDKKKLVGIVDVEDVFSAYLS
jgi:CBS domain-containing protein